MILRGAGVGVVLLALACASSLDELDAEAPHAGVRWCSGGTVDAG